MELALTNLGMYDVEELNENEIQEVVGGDGADWAIAAGGLVIAAACAAGTIAPAIGVIYAAAVLAYYSAPYVAGAVTSAQQSAAQSVQYYAQLCAQYPQYAPQIMAQFYAQYGVH